MVGIIRYLVQPKYRLYSSMHKTRQMQGIARQNRCFSLLLATYGASRTLLESLLAGAGFKPSFGIQPPFTL